MQMPFLHQVWRLPVQFSSTTTALLSLLHATALCGLYTSMPPFPRGRMSGWPFELLFARTSELAAMGMQNTGRAGLLRACHAVYDAKCATDRCAPRCLIPLRKHISRSTLCDSASSWAPTLSCD